MSNTNGHANGHAATDGNVVEDVIVIGSGPAGFTAGLYAARANLSPLLITGNDYGGQVSITYDIENYPGFPESLSGPELVEKLKEQAEKFGTRVEFDYVNEIVVDRHPFVVRTPSGAEYLTQVASSSAPARGRATWRCPARRNTPARASATAPPVTASSSAARMWSSSAAATARRRRRSS